MAEQVAGTNTDDGNLRPQGVHKRGRRGGAAAMMTNFQNPDRRVCPISCEPRFEFDSSVACEPQLDLAETDPQDDGVVIANALAFPLRHGRTERLDLDRAGFDARA
jgi:hypothetical protein